MVAPSKYQSCSRGQSLEISYFGVCDGPEIIRDCLKNSRDVTWKILQYNLNVTKKIES